MLSVGVILDAVDEAWELDEVEEEDGETEEDRAVGGNSRLVR